MRHTTNPSHAVRGLLAALAATCLLAAGCGSDDDGGGGGAAGETGASSSGATVKVTEKDFAIEPKDARVDEPGQIRFEVVNRGNAPHALEIEAPDGEVETDTLDPGQSGTVEARLEEGTYTWYCPVGNHRERGMEGTVTVGSGGGGGGGGDTGSSGGGAGY